MPDNVGDMTCGCGLDDNSSFWDFGSITHSLPEGIYAFGRGVTDSHRFWRRCPGRYLVIALIM